MGRHGSRPYQRLAFDTPRSASALPFHTLLRQRLWWNGLDDLEFGNGFMAELFGFFAGLRRDFVEGQNV